MAAEAGSAFVAGWAAIVVVVDSNLLAFRNGGGF